MQVNVPVQYEISWPEVVGAIIFLISLIWLVSSAYNKIMRRFDSVEERMTSMEERNERADQETASVKREQHIQQEKIAVMAEQMSNNTKTLERIDRGIEDLQRYIRDQGVKK